MSACAKTRIYMHSHVYTCDPRSMSEQIACYIFNFFQSTFNPSLHHDQ